MRYFDASAIVKFAVPEPESRELRDHVSVNPTVQNFTSVVARTEVALAMARQSSAPEQIVGDEPGAMHIRDLPLLLVDVDEAVAQAAAAIGTATGLRTLDALHVATAVAFRARLTEVITYDKAMIAACQTLGLTVVSPGA